MIPVEGVGECNDLLMSVTGAPLVSTLIYVCIYRVTVSWRIPFVI